MNTLEKEHQRFTKTEKKQLLIFALVAFGLSYGLGIFLWHGYEKNVDTGIIPVAQMFYPAAGVMAAYFVTKREDKLFPKRFYTTYLIITAVMVVAAILSVLFPSDAWNMGTSYICMFGSGLAWLMILVEMNAAGRSAYGLKKRNVNTSVFCVVLFIVLHVMRLVLIAAMQGEMLDMKDSLGSVVSLGNLLSLAINFFVVFLPFFGEEYGWRYFLQPLLQRRFGLVKGVVLLGVLWGIWHLPLDFFYYSTPEYGMTSVAAQVVTCVTLGIFISYTYMKTENIWVPVIIHYLYNNMIALSSGESAGIAKQMFGWEEVGMLLLVNAIVFGSFLGTKYFQKQKIQK